MQRREPPKEQAAPRVQPRGHSDPCDPQVPEEPRDAERLMQLPGHARVRRRPSHHLSLPRSPASLVPPRSSHPIPPPRSLCRSRPLSSPGSPVPHVPSPSSSRSRAPSPATHLSAFSGVPKPRGWTRTPPALPRPKPGRFTCAPPCSTSTSQASRRPAEGRRSSSVRSGPGPHAHHPGLRSLTHVSPRPLKEPHCSVRPEAERRGTFSFKRRG